VEPGNNKRWSQNQHAAAKEVEEGKFDVVVEVEIGIHGKEMPLINLYLPKHRLFFRLKVKKGLTFLMTELFVFLEKCENLGRSDDAKRKKKGMA